MTSLLVPEFSTSRPVIIIPPELPGILLTLANQNAWSIFFVVQAGSPIGCFAIIFHVSIHFTSHRAAWARILTCAHGPFHPNRAAIRLTNGATSARVISSPRQIARDLGRRADPGPRVRLHGFNPPPENHAHRQAG
jgi:hypothetical protein